MSHGCFISFKKEDLKYKDKIVKKLGIERILGRALDKLIPSDNLDEVMEIIKNEYMKNTTVTLFLIGEHSSEKEGKDQKGNKNAYIIKELQATLYDKKGFKRSGLLGIVLPEMEKKIYNGKKLCPICNCNHNNISINDDTFIKEFSANYWLKEPTSKCGCYSDDDSFCVLVRYSVFMSDPDKYINQAYDKLNQEINNHVHWHDLR